MTLIVTSSVKAHRLQQPETILSPLEHLMQTGSPPSLPFEGRLLEAAPRLTSNSAAKSGTACIRLTAKSIASASLRARSSLSSSAKLSPRSESILRRAALTPSSRRPRSDEGEVVQISSRISSKELEDQRCVNHAFSFDRAKDFSSGTSRRSANEYM